MKNNLSVFALVAAFAALGISIYHPVNRGVGALQSEAKKETTYERVMRTRTIRCGYFVWPPFLTKDLNTGALSGLNYDVAEEMGKLLDLKIEWSQELNFSSYLQDLANGRYDMECTGGWPNAERGEHVYFGKPYAYIPLATVVRASDDRFNLNWDAINDASVTVATLDGETSSVIRNSRFPKSRRISLPSNAPPTDLLMNIETQKADVTFFDLFSAKQYIEKNPGKLKIVNYQKPVYLITLTPTLPQDDRFKQMIDLTIEQMLLSGEIESLLRKYEPSASMFLRVNDPYKTTLLP